MLDEVAEAVQEGRRPLIAAASGLSRLGNPDRLPRLEAVPLTGIKGMNLQRPREPLFGEGVPRRGLNFDAQRRAALRRGRIKVVAEGVECGPARLQQRAGAQNISADRHGIWACAHRARPEEDRVGCGLSEKWREDGDVASVCG